MSVDSQLKGVLDNALNDFINQHKMFTAFDLTAHIRNSNSANGLHVFHSVVKQYVHDRFDDPRSLFNGVGYDRQLASFGNPPPWVYFIPGVHDPAKYAPVVFSDVTQPPAPVPAAPTQFAPKPPQAQAKKAVAAAFAGITRR
jgi:hypothetical protein